MPLEATTETFIHRFVPGAGSAPSTLLLLHGTGGDESDLLSLGQMLRSDAALLSPRGRVLENGMPRFFRRIAPGIFDQEDLIQRTHELADWIGAAVAVYSLDPANIIGVGYSNGANIAASLMLLRPEVLRGAILLRPMVPLVPKTLPDLKGRAVLIAASRTDPIVPLAQSEDLARLLGEAGAEVDLRWHSGGHGLGQTDVAVARNWLESHAGD